MPGRSRRADDKRRSGAGNRISKKTTEYEGNGSGSALGGIFNDRRRANGKAKRAG